MILQDYRRKATQHTLVSRHQISSASTLDRSDQSRTATKRKGFQQKLFQKMDRHLRTKSMTPSDALGDRTKCHSYFKTRRSRNIKMPSIDSYHRNSVSVMYHPQTPRSKSAWPYHRAQYITTKPALGQRPHIHMAIRKPEDGPQTNLVAILDRPLSLSLLSMKSLKHGSTDCRQTQRGRTGSVLDRASIHGIQMVCLRYIDQIARPLSRRCRILQFETPSHRLESTLVSSPWTALIKVLWTPLVRTLCPCPQSSATIMTARSIQQLLRDPIASALIVKSGMRGAAKAGGT